MRPRHCGTFYCPKRSGFFRASTVRRTALFDHALEQVVYSGMGPQESYRDKHRGSSHGRYESTVTAMHEDYIFRRKMAAIMTVTM